MSERLDFSVITLFPELFDVIQKEGVFSRALERGLLSLDTVPLRQFAMDPRRNVDSHPIGGGDGMVLLPEVVEAAITSVKRPESYVVCLTPAGKVFDNRVARKLSTKKHLIFLCGRYAGFDDRTLKTQVDLELSLGDFVLSGGELPCMCVMDTVSRFVPGVLGNTESADTDSFEDGLLEAPAFTKPLQYAGMSVPDVLLSGDHKKISQYRKKMQLKKTALMRPDLINLVWETLSRSEKAYVERIWKHEQD